nr:hypothetical protein [uncultured bacterium]
MIACFSTFICKFIPFIYSAKVQSRFKRQSNTAWKCQINLLFYDFFKFQFDNNFSLLYF